MTATPDAHWPGSVWYQGDSLTWPGYAEAFRSGTVRAPQFLWPPGMALLLALLWDGSSGGIFALKILWCLLGALTVGLAFLALRRHFGAAVALAVGLASSFGTGLILLSTSLNNETPYLLLAVASFLVVPSTGHRPRIWELLGWAILQGLCCLVRPEHVLFFLMGVPIMLAAALRGGGQTRRWATVASLIGGFALPLIPWQVHLHAAIHRFNVEEPQWAPESEKQLRDLERQLSHVTWDRNAAVERERLPAYSRRLVGDFIALTVLYRGRTMIEAADLRIVEDAFGHPPEPLGSYAFVSLSGPLNFYTVFNPYSKPGHNRRFLEEMKPPLKGGEGAYPRSLLLGPPPRGTLSFDYPPHMHLINHGYAEGMRWILKHPAQAAVLIVRKIGRFLAGVALGFSGYGLPGGLTGTQPPVDLVLPDGSVPVWGWRILLVGLCTIGFLCGSRSPALSLWLAFLGSKILITIFFFGFGRIGASASPAAFLGAALGLQKCGEWVSGRTGHRPSIRLRPLWVLTLALLVLGVATEAVRWSSRPDPLVDGTPSSRLGVSEGLIHREHRIVAP